MIYILLLPRLSANGKTVGIAAVCSSGADPPKTGLDPPKTGVTDAFS